ncbi:hypothetical protein RVU96_17670, partial [Bordetella avium]
LRAALASAPVAGEAQSPIGFVDPVYVAGRQRGMKWNAKIYDAPNQEATAPLYAAPQASTAADARDALAWGVIENARAAMDASFESGDESLGVSVPSHLAAALCLALDELDAIVAKQGEGETA